jgi:hypothetical protein
MLPVKELSKIAFREFSKGWISEYDVDSLDVPLNCFKDAINVEVNEPNGAISRSPGYYPVFSDLPNPDTETIKYFKRFSVENGDAIVVWYTSRIYCRFPGESWIELTEHFTGSVSIVGVGGDENYLEVSNGFSNWNVNDYYKNWVVYNQTQDEYAFIRQHEVLSNSARLHLVEELSEKSWVETDTFIFYRNLYSENSLDMSAFAPLTLDGRLRVGTGTSDDCPAQWIGKTSGSYKFRAGGMDRIIDLSSNNLLLEKLNRDVGGGFSVVAFYGLDMQVVVTAIDIEGQEFVISDKSGINKIPALKGLEPNYYVQIILYIDPSLFSKRISKVCLYANSNLTTKGIFYLLEEKLLNDSTTVIQKVAVGYAIDWIVDYVESGRLLYYLPSFSVEANFKSVKYHKGRVYIISDDYPNYVRFTQFNTNAAENHDYFPFDESSGYGYFIPTSEISYSNSAIAETKDDNLMVFKKEAVYAYLIQQSNSLIKSIVQVFKSLGTISENTIDDTSDKGVFFLDYVNLYWYTGGIAEPKRMFDGKIAKWYLAQPTLYKDEALLKYNKQTDELWIWFYNKIIVYSFENDNFKVLCPYHTIHWMDFNKTDNYIEISANRKIQTWDYSLNRVYDHDGFAIIEPYLETHRVSTDLLANNKIDEMYAEFDVDANFQIALYLDRGSLLLQAHTFLSTKKSCRGGVRGGTMVSRFGMKVLFGTVAVAQKVFELGVGVLPLGGKYEARKA